MTFRPDPPIETRMPLPLTACPAPEEPGATADRLSGKPRGLPKDMCALLSACTGEDGERNSREETRKGMPARQKEMRTPMVSRYLNERARACTSTAMSHGIGTGRTVCRTGRRLPRVRAPPLAPAGQCGGRHVAWL